MICPFMSYRNYGAEDYTKSPLVDCQKQNCGCWSTYANRCGLINNGV